MERVNLMSYAKVDQSHRLPCRFTAERIRDEMGRDEELREFVMSRIHEHGGHRGGSSGGSNQQGGRGISLKLSAVRKGYKTLLPRTRKTKDGSTQL